MPEGPEVRIVADELSKVCIGKYLYSHYQYGRLLQIYTVGKQLYFIFENPGSLILNSSLGIYGHWLMNDVWLKLKSNPNTKREPRAIFKWGEIVKSDDKYIFNLENTIVYDDKLSYGKITWLTREEAFKKMENFPNDWMQMLFPQSNCLIPVPPSTLTCSREIFIKTCNKYNKPIVDVLMEQKYMSGIGNYIKSECLYLAGINPFRNAKTLTLEEINKLFDCICWVFQSSYLVCGMTHGDFISPFGNKGQYEAWCYKLKTTRDGKYKVEEVKRNKNDRTTYWCPIVQI